MKSLALILAACCMLASCNEKAYAAAPCAPATVYDVQVYVHGTLVRSYEANTPAPFHDKSYYAKPMATSFGDGTIITSMIYDRTGTGSACTGVVFVAAPKRKELAEQEGGSNE